MKQKIFTICLILISLLALTACGGPTWQEKYDLGMRYLDEGNYEEAIIAFNAAIKIDPKRADSYISLADTYVAMGDHIEAVDVLNLGFENTGDVIIKKRVKAIILNEFGEIRFEFRPEFKPHEELSDNEKDALNQLMNAAETKTYLNLIETVSDMDDFTFLTIKDNYKIMARMNRQDYGGYQGIVTHIKLEMRPEEGIGYYYSIASGENGYSRNIYATGKCANWNWNGEVSRVEKQVVPRGYNGTDAVYSVEESTSSGQMINSLRHGLTTQTTIFYDSTWENRKNIIDYKMSFENGYSTQKFVKYGEDEWEIAETEFIKAEIDTDLSASMSITSADMNPQYW